MCDLNPNLGSESGKLQRFADGVVVMKQETTAGTADATDISIKIKRMKEGADFYQLNLVRGETINSRRC